MGDRFRLVRTGPGDAFFNMGLDEAILESVSRGESPPTLRTYSWMPRAITLGYFQGIEEEVDREACEAAGVDITRRITGGGAVFHDDEVTYSIILPEGSPLSPPSIIESYGLICSGIMAGLGFLGVEARFAPINDIVSGGKKVSGNAQTRKRGCLLQHGTLLLSVDPERMFSLLRVPKEKSIGRLTEEIEARVSSVSRILGRTVAFKEAEVALVRGFSEALGIELVPGSPSCAELMRAQELAKEKFGSEEWKRRR
ncbi:MAG TPA: biotin/lipoate A/B protein ligase family protein [Rectinemataceae bacterium]